jgi:response regulator RpfG family c-di-GMP phosphodiesterase
MPLAGSKWGSQQMNLESTGGKSPLVLLVDPFVTSRHFMWRALSRTFGVLEAGTAEAARAWIANRPDIDAVVVQDELPDQRGLELVRELVKARHPVARQAIVLTRLTPDWAAITQAGLTLIERGDLRALSAKLASWLLSRDAVLAKALMREADRLSA